MSEQIKKTAVAAASIGVAESYLISGVTRLPLNFWQAQPTYAAIANGASAPYRAFCSRAIRYSWYSSQ